MMSCWQSAAGRCARLPRGARHLPDRALVAGIPNLAARDESRAAGNSVGRLVVSIASDIADPRRRLEAIRESTRDAKTRNRLIPVSINRTTAAIGNYLMSVRPRDSSEAMADRTRVLNLVISNVPGPAKPRYMYGALLRNLSRFGADARSAAEYHPAQLPGRP